MALRLAIGRDGVGLELADPVELGCVRVVELSTALPGTRFPVDVSGGVTRFRHRRGELRVVRLEIAARAVERWAATRLRGLVGTRTPDVWIEVSPARATVCVAALPGPEEEGEHSAAAAAVGASATDAPVVAFDLHALVGDTQNLVLVVANARGAGLPTAAHVIAVACVETILGGLAERHGAIFVVKSPAAVLARTLLPDAGARAPSTDDVRWTSLGAADDTWFLFAMRGAIAAAPTSDALRAREVAMILVDADDALVRGDLAAARTRYLEALERAPGHGEIAARLVAIDARVEGRAEAAIATITEAKARGAEDRFGVAPGELFASIGDVDAALASLEHAGDTEHAPALAARAFELAARATPDAEAAARWLDRAVSRAPRTASARWARVRARLLLGRLEDALADVEHLEALARGARAKYAVWLAGGQAWRAAGLGSRSAALFERALRFAPDEAEALAGLGAALIGEGRATRGASLLVRALELAETAPTKTSDPRKVRTIQAVAIRLLLAEALADHLDDLPTAVAHAAAIPVEASEAPVARGLEGRWRARLGDVVGAGLAFARLRDLAATFAAPADAPRTRAIVALLLEAAQLESLVRRDPLAAQRHLAVALRLVPHDPVVRLAYREAGALVLAASRPEAKNDPPQPPQPPQPLQPLPPVPALETAPLLHDVSAGPPGAPPPLPPGSEETDALRAVRVEELTRRLQATPGDDAISDELTALLEVLDRGHELVALMSGRLEDASGERRVVLAAQTREILQRMAAKADAAGSDDAALFRDAIDSLA